MEMMVMARPWAVKAVATDGWFTGYASVYGKIDHQNEVVSAGAFTRTLKKWRGEGKLPAMLWMHDPSQPIGLWTAMEEDAQGLRVEGRLALRTQKGAEAYELLKLGALTGLSIGYRVVKSSVDRKSKARLLTEVDLFEVSLVTFPANESARVREVKRCAEGGAMGAPKDDDEMTRAIVGRLQQAACILKTTKYVPQRRV